MLIQKQSLQTRQLHFDGYSVNFAYKPIGQRGDPLKIIVYRVFIDIARESEPTFPCTCWVRAVAFLSAISAKLNIFQALCIATASGGLQDRHTEVQTCSTLSPFRGYNVEKYPFVPLVGSLSLTIAYETDSFRRFCIRVLSVCSYRNRAVRFDSSISTAIA